MYKLKLKGMLKYTHFISDKPQHCCKRNKGGGLRVFIINRQKYNEE